MSCEVKEGGVGEAVLGSRNPVPADPVRL